MAKETFRGLFKMSDSILDSLRVKEPSMTALPPSIRFLTVGALSSTPSSTTANLPIEPAVLELAISPVRLPNSCPPSEVKSKATYQPPD